MKRLFIHIGTEKTGTTTLQHFLAKNEGNLRHNQFSFLCDPGKSYFFESQDGKMVGHFPVAACFSTTCPEYLPENRYLPRETLFSDLLGDMRRADSAIILSAEHFSSRIRDARDLEYLRDSFAEFDVSIVIYVRPQYEMLTSSYNTGVITGRRAPFSYDANIQANPYFNHYETVKLWSSVFGRNKIIVKNFNALLDGDIRKDFLSLIGIENYRNFDFDGNRNLSLNAKHVELIRKANDHLPVFQECSNPQQWELACRARNALSKISGLRGPALSAILTHDDARKIDELFDETNRRLEQEFMRDGALDNWRVIRAGGEPEALTISTDEWSLAAADIAMSYAKLEAQIDSLKGELSTVYRSASWKSTTILRKFNALIKRFVL
jgi:hypothetical protein